MFGFENSSWNQDLRESFGIALFQGRAGPKPNQSGFVESRKSYFFRAKSLLLLRGIVKMLLLCEIAEVFLPLREIAKVSFFCGESRKCFFFCVKSRKCYFFCVAYQKYYFLCVESQKYYIYCVDSAPTTSRVLWMIGARKWISCLKEIIIFKWLFMERKEILKK